jgi:hypothetical protein
MPNAGPLDDYESLMGFFSDELSNLSRYAGMSVVPIEDRLRHLSSVFTSLNDMIKNTIAARESEDGSEDVDE